MSISKSNDTDSKECSDETHEMLDNATSHHPGAILQHERKRQGHSIEYIAAKLHLRAKVIESIEADDYPKMPEPVFVKGYLRAYANLLAIDSAPLLEKYLAMQPEIPQQAERLLWQTTKTTHASEKWIRVGTGIFACAVVAAVFFWWQKNKEAESFFSQHVRAAEKTQTSDIHLTDLSSMRSLLSSNPELSPLELKDD